MPDAERRARGRCVSERAAETAYELPYRGFKPPGRLEHVFQSNEFNANVWVDEQEVPYTFDPAHPYNWVRVRLFGGRSLFWSRQSFRLSDYEFKAKSHDGFGEDWPIDHAELAPFYSRVEEIFQVAGRDGWSAADAGRQLRARRRSVVASRCSDSWRQASRSVCPSASSAARWAVTAWRARSICCCRMRRGRASSRRSRTRWCARYRGQEHRAAERLSLRRPPFAPRDACEGARRGAGGGNAGEHAAAVELRDRRTPAAWWATT